MIIVQDSIVVTPYLTWEYSHDPDIQYLKCPPPAPVRTHMPPWFKQLKAKKEEIPLAEQQTIRNCLGFRGLANIGYTIPLPETLNGYDTYFSRGRLHPEMLAGTHWANKGNIPWCNEDNSLYEYRLKLLNWPWRAKMAKGWRLLILPYLLDWSTDWNEFAGTVEPNYEIEQGTGIGTGLKWTHPIDIQYNYYNLETVIAFKRSVNGKTEFEIPKGTLTFCAVPIYDPTMPEINFNRKDVTFWKEGNKYMHNDYVYYNGKQYQAFRDAPVGPWRIEDWLEIPDGEQQ